MIQGLLFWYSLVMVVLPQEVLSTTFQAPNVTVENFQCSDHSDSSGFFLYTLKICVQQMLNIGVKGFPDSTTSFFTAPPEKLVPPFFWGMISCYSKPQTMEHMWQCRTCLDFARNNIYALCPGAGSAQVLLVDCFLRYSFEGPLDICLPPPAE